MTRRFSSRLSKSESLALWAWTPLSTPAAHGPSKMPTTATRAYSNSISPTPSTLSTESSPCSWSVNTSLALPDGRNGVMPKNQTLFSGSTQSSSTGVQQGDPLGPLLFALAIQPFAQALKNLDVQGSKLDLTAFLLGRRSPRWRSPSGRCCPRCCSAPLR